ncbi:NAD-P-binding protein [Trametes coccinea BRFM310]|uniref:NAD-P-binding protein n=1 Tax=Trametes coccinea (strain BRFM310) TaxID=1353009 RepID=A0A1Y2IM81_TRAC3|nr:NAD-P-binding protein [Trametes coccinea BRFM310]
MPILSPPSRILVTGANGYVGCWAVRALLDKGYSVRAVVRTEDKARSLSTLIKAKHPSVTDSQFDCAVIPDIISPEAIDALLHDIQGIVHTATPVTFVLDDPEEYIRPAVEGTLNILRSAAKHPEIKRIVITSSIGAVAESSVEKSQLYTDEDFNEVAVEAVQRLGRAASGMSKYNASKVLAERAAWTFCEHNKDSLPYEICVTAPGWICGPIPDDPPSPKSFVTPSAIMEWTQLFVSPPPPPHPAVPFNYIDIRDVVEMHIRALELPEAGGERFIATSHVCTWQDWYDAAADMDFLPGLHRLHPPRSPEQRGAAQLPPHPIFSNEKAKRKLNMVFKTVPETLKALVDDFGARGWLKHLEVI